MCVFKYHAFIYFLRPPPWYGTTLLVYLWEWYIPLNFTFLNQWQYSVSIWGGKVSAAAPWRNKWKKGRNRGKCEKYVARVKSNEKYHMKNVCLGKKNNFRPHKTSYFWEKIWRREGSEEGQQLLCLFYSITRMWYYYIVLILTKTW
jgi:hypothetical protein